MQNAAIVSEGLTVIRENVKALDNVTFSIDPGKITGLIGPSGSGKTTLMRCIIGAQVITRGQLTVFGAPAGAEALRYQIGYVSQAPAVYSDLTVQQNLEYFALIIGCRAEAIDRVLKQVDLEPQRHQITATLSGGQLARVSLAVALLGEAPLLILDEPTVGLDPVLRHELWDLFKHLASGGRTLLISSHVMDEAEQCTDILLLRDAKVLSHGSRNDLLAKTKTSKVEDAFLKLVERGDHAS